MQLLALTVLNAGGPPSDKGPGSGHYDHIHIEIQTDPDWGPARRRLVFQSPEGEGHLSMVDSGDHYRVTSSEVPQKLLGKGLGNKLYQKAIDLARSEGKTEIRSDTSVTDAAAGMWKHLGATRQKTDFGLQYVLKIQAGGVGSGRYPKGSGVDRSAIGKRNKIQIVGQKEQRIANHSEQELSDALGIPRSGNNRPFDLQDQSRGVEVKTLLFQKNNKITMIKSALARKNEEAQRLGLRTYTVVVDKRTDAHTYYYAKGLGSFVIRGMHKANSMSELKNAIK